MGIIEKQPDFQYWKRDMNAEVNTQDDFQLGKEAFDWMDKIVEICDWKYQKHEKLVNMKISNKNDWNRKTYN